MKHSLENASQLVAQESEGTSPHNEGFGASAMSLPAAPVSEGPEPGLMHHKM